MSNSKLEQAADKIKKAMLDDLKARGLTAKQYTDKVEEYLDFWMRRQQLKADVLERGITVIDCRGCVAENRSVSLEIQASRQMLAIFQALGFRDIACTSKAVAPEDDEL